MFKKEAKGKTEDISLGGLLEPADVLLVTSPLAWEATPSLGLHLLQTNCRNVGIKTKILYSNLLYSNLIGADLNITISHDYYLLLGERIFATTAFNVSSVSIGRVMHKFLDPAWVPDQAWKVKGNLEDPHVPEPLVTFRKWIDTVDLEYLESLTNDWLRALARQIVKIGFRIVGCSTTHGGLLPAVAVLNCIKKADPDVITVIGGALCESEMAEGILSLKTNIDYIFSGEGEITFPSMVKQILEGRLPKEEIIHGQDVIDLDTNPLPDYREYVEQRERLHPDWSSDKNKYALPFETSRGCWYGKCTFCGINGKRNVFRKKSPDRVIKDLKTLVERHSMNFVIMSDTMMPQKYFETLVSRLAAEIPSTEIIYEMKANLTLDQVLSLKRAAIMFRPGIESLSPSLLRHMKKPCTARRNIALLRYARSAGMYVVWSILYGFPGDKTSEYEEMLHLIPLIRHLQPPAEMLPLVLWRYSQYHISPEAFGISKLRPAEIHKDTLPPHADLDKISYYFTSDFPSQSRENPVIIIALWEELQAWQRAWATYEKFPLDILLPTLHVVRKTYDRYVLEDTRGLTGRPKRMEIDRKQASFLLVAHPLEAVPDVDVRWAVDAGLGVVMESWFVPLATAEPKLLQEFERECVK